VFSRTEGGGTTGKTLAPVSGTPRPAATPPHKEYAHVDATKRIRSRFPRRW